MSLGDKMKNNTLKETQCEDDKLKFKILHDFTIKLVSQSKNIEPNIQRIVNKRFWNLLK